MLQYLRAVLAAMEMRDDFRKDEKIKFNDKSIVNIG